MTDNVLIGQETPVIYIHKCNDRFTRSEYVTLSLYPKLTGAECDFVCLGTLKYQPSEGTDNVG